MFENPRRGRQARNVPKILDLKSSSEQIFSRKLPLGAPGLSELVIDDYYDYFKESLRIYNSNNFDAKNTRV